MTDPESAERGRIRENIELAFIAGKIDAQQAADALAGLEAEWSEMK